MSEQAALKQCIAHHIAANWRNVELQAMFQLLLLHPNLLKHIEDR